MGYAIIAICLFTPLLILWLTWKFPLLNKVGTIIIAYVIGCLLGLTGLIPDTPEVHKIQTDIATYTIPFAIPLLLFSSDLKSWTRLAPSFIKSTLLGIAGCCIAITIGFLICCGENPDTFACIGGMLSVMDGSCHLLATTWEFKENIDLERAKASKAKAEEILAKPDLDDKTKALAEARLARANIRIGVAE